MSPRFENPRLAQNDYDSPPSSESEIKFRPSSETMQDVRDFFAFSEANGIEARRSTGWSTDDIIYNDFYSVQDHANDIHENDPAFLEMENRYNANVKSTENWIVSMRGWLEKHGDPQGIEISETMKEKGWLYLKGNGGFDHNQPIGRVYLNIKVDHIPSIFATILDELRKAGVNFDTKIPGTGNVEDFNRPDKMVLYFNDNSTEEVLKILNAIQSQHSNLFEANVPKCTTKLKNSNGQPMIGVSFGEQPRDKGSSFGEVRSKVLASIYEEARKQNLSMRDPAFRFPEKFQRACKFFGVDPQNMAFSFQEDGPKPFNTFRT